MKLFLLSMLLFAGLSGPAEADVYNPAYLELRQTDHENFDVLWKVPARGADKRLALYLELPGDVRNTKPIRTTFVGNAVVESFSIRRDRGLTGANINIRGLSQISSEVLVRIERLDDSTEVARLTSAAPSFVVAGKPGYWQVVNTYLVFGMQHIWEGPDHLLFVACLILIARSWRRILITITGFTIAHSLTLTLAVLDLIRVPVPPVEAVIALSIVFLAREIALDRRDTLTWRFPIAVSGSFGLLHGFGFASALADIGLPQTEVPAALLSFNVGVEIGQLAFVIAIVGTALTISLALKALAVERTDWLDRLSKPIAYSIGSITMFWTIDRLGGFWG